MNAPRLALCSISVGRHLRRNTPGAEHDSIWIGEFSAIDRQEPTPEACSHRSCSNSQAGESTGQVETLIVGYWLATCIG